MHSRVAYFLGSVLEAEGVNDIPPISRFGRNGKEHRDSACSCLWIHSKFIRRGPCWWDGRWQLALVLLCRQCLHKPTADFEFENTSTESEHARKHARTQKSRTARSTGSTKHESMNRSKARIDRKIESTKAQKAQKAQSSTHRESAEKAGHPDGALLLAAIGWRYGREIVRVRMPAGNVRFM